MVTEEIGKTSIRNCKCVYNGCLTTLVIASSINPCETNNNFNKIIKSTGTKDQHHTHSQLPIDALHSQTRKIINAVLVLIRQNESDYDNGLPLKYNRPSSPINDKEQMQLVRSVAIAVRDLLQTLDHGPVSIRNMFEKRCNQISNLVVSLIETVRQRDYDNMGEHAINVARTAKILFDDILKES